MTDDLSGELAEVQAAAAATAADEQDPPDESTPAEDCPTCGRPLDPDGMLAAATSNDELKLLKAIRDRLAAAIEDCPMRDLSPLTRRLQDVMKEIRELVERQDKESGSTNKAGETGGDTTQGDKWDPTTDV